MKHAVFVLLILLFSVPNANALPVVTFIENNLNIELYATYFEAVRPDRNQEMPTGTQVVWNYDGSFFDLFPTDDTYYASLNSNATYCHSKTMLIDNSDHAHLSSSVTVDDDSSGYGTLPGLTAYAISDWDATFTVNGDGAAAIIGGWGGIYGVHNYSQLIDMTLGTSVIWPSDNSQLILQDGHTYKYSGHTSQNQIDGYGGLDRDTGYFLNLYNTAISVPEPHHIIIFLTGIILLFLYLRVAIGFSTRNQTAR